MTAHPEVCFDLNTQIRFGIVWIGMLRLVGHRALLSRNRLFQIAASVQATIGHLTQSSAAGCAHWSASPVSESDRLGRSFPIWKRAAGWDRPRR